jgi:CheY-like chemotaxis protein
MSKILLVEDDNSLRNAYDMILRTKNYFVETASNGQEALDKLQHYDPSLILLDLLMPVMDGLEFLENYEPQNNFKAPVLLLTNMPSSPNVTRCMQLGVKKVVIKSSLTPSELLEVVDQNLKN